VYSSSVINAIFAVQEIVVLIEKFRLWRFRLQAIPPMPKCGPQSPLPLRVSFVCFDVIGRNYTTQLAGQSRFQVVPGFPQITPTAIRNTWKAASIHVEQVGD